MTSPPEHPGLPPWLRIGLVVLAVVAVAIIVAMVLGLGGEHGPGRHNMGAR